MSEGRYYLSEQDHRERHERLENELGYSPQTGGRGCGGGYSTEGPPCGGCIDCLHGMVCHSFRQEREWANRVQAAGLELAAPECLPIVVHAEYHDDYGHRRAGEPYRKVIYT